MEAFIKQLKKEGYDGIIDGKDEEAEFVAFHPTQIKSATGNSGAFDTGSPDITKSIMLVMKSKQPNPRSAADQLKVGTQIEREHTDDPKVAGKIVRDHLAEFSAYSFYRVG